MPTFVLIETLGTQEYIFRSNRLPENIGASELVRRATTDWVWEAVHGAQGTDWARNLDYDAQPRDAPAEVILTAGGNAFVRCDSEQKARDIVWTITRRALREAPGLRLNAALHTPQTADVRLADVRKMLTETLTDTRARALATASLGGLSVTAPCASTGQPASVRWVGEGDEADRRVSAEVAAKLCAARSRAGTENAGLCRGGRAANDRLRGIFKTMREALEERLGVRVDFSDQLDHLGRTDGEASYLAIVHADGNGIGKFFKEGAPERAGLREEIAHLQERSKKAGAAALEALQAAMTRVADALRREDGVPALAAPEGSSVPDLALFRGKDDKGPFYVFPVRPIVFGGDDVTVVCDGRIGLAFTTAYLRAFEEAAAKHGLNGEGRRITASAGVAIVKAHYPFAQAYALAEALTGHAKTLSRKENGVATLDWHVAQSAVYGDDVARLREREYEVAAGTATLRPVRVGTDHPDLRTWATVETGIAGFRERAWATRRSKAKRLADRLREGPHATRAFLEALAAAQHVQGNTDPVLPRLNLDDPAPGGAGLPTSAAERADAGEALRQAVAKHTEAAETVRKTGWRDRRSPYADAVSLLDLYLPLVPADAPPSASHS